MYILICVFLCLSHTFMYKPVATNPQLHRSSFATLGIAQSKRRSAAAAAFVHEVCQLWHCLLCAIPSVAKKKELRPYQYINI